MNNFLGHKGVPLPQMKSTLRPLEILPERLVDDLGDGQAVQVSLASDRLDPAALDMEGDAFGLLGGIAGLRGEVYPRPDLAALPTSGAPMPALPVDSLCTLGGLSLERTGIQ